MPVTPKTQHLLNADSAPRGTCMPSFGTGSLFLLGSVALLSACSISPSSPFASVQEKTVTTTNAPHTARPLKSFDDGSKPFTMPEIQDHLLRVLALPPEQINKENVENIFGVVLEGKYNVFYEEISDDRRIDFSIEAPPPSPTGSTFTYSTSIKKEPVDGQERRSGKPIDIPDKFKLSYPDFVRQLEASGWNFVGVHRSHGVFYNLFKKDLFRVSLYIDDYKEMGQGISDYSQTHISRIIVYKSNY